MGKSNRDLLPAGIAASESPLLMLEAYVEMKLLLAEVVAVLEQGADFQTGPAGKHRDLPRRIRAALALPI